MLYALLVIAVLLLLSWLYWTNKNLPPGPWGLPILGYLPWLDPKAPYVTLTELSHRYGPIFSVKLGSVYTVVLTDVKVIRQALAKNVYVGRAPLYLTHGIMKGCGLICAQGELWKDQRKFVGNCLKKFGMVKYGGKQETLESWILDEVHVAFKILGRSIKSDGTSDPVDPQYALRNCVGNVMNYIVLGKKFAEDDPRWLWLLELQDEGTKQIGIAGPLNFLPFLRHFGSMRKSMDFLINGIEDTHKVYQEIIDEYDATTNPEHSNHFVAAFLEERKKRVGLPSEEFFTDQQFHYLLADLFGAGLDTTLTTLLWFLLYVAVHQDVQSQIHEELDGVLGKTECVSLENVAALPYFKAVLTETQRIRSVVPVGIPHGATEESVLEGFRIPVGTMIVPLQWAVHMNEQYWKDPEVFNPARFISEEGQFNATEAFIPFQTGKRMCIGDELARMILYLFGANILHKFHIRLPENAPPDFNGICGLTLVPKPYQLQLTHRV